MVEFFCILHIMLLYVSVRLIAIHNDWSWISWTLDNKDRLWWFYHHRLDGKLYINFIQGNWISYIVFVLVVIYLFEMVCVFREAMDCSIIENMILSQRLKKVISNVLLILFTQKEMRLGDDNQINICYDLFLDKYELIISF